MSTAFVRPVKPKNFLLVAGSILFFVIFILLFNRFSKMRDYGLLLDADVMKIYQDDILIQTVDEPSSIVTSYTGTVSVGVLSNLDLKHSATQELYRLDFFQGEKRLCSIQILTPKDPSTVDLSASNTWHRLGSFPVVLYENGHFFTFGEHFLTSLIKFLPTTSLT